MVGQTRLFGESYLWDLREEGDFLDCYSVTSKSQPLSPAEAAKVALGQAPAWVDALMALRDRLVKPLGLKTGTWGAEEVPLDRPLQVDDAIGIFRIEKLSDKEIILGEDDKHLDFRVSVLRHERGYQIATWVQPHNWMGRSYLALILPFHKLIARSTARQLETHLKTLAD